VSEEKDILHKTKQKKANRISHILPRNFCLKHVIEDTMEGRIGKQLLDELKESREYCNLKREALDRTLWRINFGRGCGLVTRETT
jgi:hypothetical protein